MPPPRRPPNFCFANIGLRGWVDKVEQMTKTQMNPLPKIATNIIESLRNQFEGLSLNKGTRSKMALFAGIESEAMNKVGLA